MPPAPSGCPCSCSRPVQPRSQRHHITALTGFPFPHTRHAARALSLPSHRTRSQSADRKLDRAARPSGSTGALGLNGRALLLGSMALSVGQLRVASRKGNCVSGAWGSWRCREPSAGSEGAARVIRFAPAAGCGLSADSRGGSEHPE